MKAIVRNFLIMVCLVILNSSCEQDDGWVQEVEGGVGVSKLKSISNFYYASSERPDEKFVFFYDNKGRLETYERYVPDLSGTGMIRQLRFDITYCVEDPNPLYTVAVRNLINGNPDLIVGRRKVYLDANSNFVRDVIYNESGEKVLRDHIYSRYENGFSVLIRTWHNEYNQYGVRKVLYETDANRNVTKKKIYNAHFEGAEVEEQVEAEFEITHDSKMNPLFNLTPYFSGLDVLNRYADSESRNNVVSIIPVGCPSENCATIFNYKYEDGFVSEVSPGGLSLYKRTFEYYKVASRRPTDGRRDRL